jgi:hypothetical protein
MGSTPSLQFARLAGLSSLTTRQRISEHFDNLPSTDAHLLSALDWLCAAQDQTSDGGVSYGFSLRGGWKQSYIETSGYIVETLFAVRDAFGDLEIRGKRLSERAVLIAEWLLTVQNKDGSFSNPQYGPDGIVFDTGQDLFGLINAYKRTSDQRFLAAAVEAGDWLARVSGSNGLWTRNEHFGTQHAYNSRTAWALVELQGLEPDSRRLETAIANLDWTLEQQVSSGFYRHTSFRTGKNPYTHNISYTTCGLQESGWLLHQDSYLNSAKICAEATLRLLRDDGFLPGQIDLNGLTTARYACLTGNCQFSIVWAKWFSVTGDIRYKTASERALRFVMARQEVNGKDSPIRGAIAGSSPLWGRYAPLSYPNWAAKFFIDAALLHKAWATT